MRILILYSSLERSSLLGLANGKMGGSIYFFYISRAYNNAEYRKTAEKLLNEVFTNIASVKTVDIKNGLGGIGLGIHYLIENKYVKGNPNEILKNVDDTVFRHLCSTKNGWDPDSLILTQLLFYLYIRLKESKKNREEEYIIQELSMQVLNQAYRRINPKSFEEPLSYNIEYLLPLFLLVLGNIGRLGFYKDRIGKILEELSPKILSTFPLLHTNKLYLCLTMQTIADHFAIEGWQEHIVLLRRETKIDAIFDQELKSRNIYFNNGVGSILYLLNSVKGLIVKPDICTYRQRIIQKIESSDIWQIYSQPGYIDQYKGLYDGVPGAVMTWIEAKKAMR